MRRHPAILLLLALALVVVACGDDDGGATDSSAGLASTSTAAGGASTTTTAAATTESASAVWYTDWDAGLVGRWDLASNSCAGVTEVGLSADQIQIGLGWVWVTDCRGGLLVRLDAATGEVTGRISVGACPSTMLIAHGVVWLALPSLSKVIAVDPESGAVVAEGTSELEPPVYLAAGSLDVAGSTYYWRVDEVEPNLPGGPNWQGSVWSFSLDTYVVDADFGGQIQGLAAGSGGVSVLVGPPADGTHNYTDPAYPTQMYTMDPQGNIVPVGAPFAGYYNYLAAFGGHYVATSKVSPFALVGNPGVTQVPVQMPGPPVLGPPPPGGTTGTSTSGQGPWVWIPQRGPGNIIVFPVNDPPMNPVPAFSPACTLGDEPLAVWDIAVTTPTYTNQQQALASAMDSGAFPVDRIPDEPVTPTVPSGPRVPSCGLSYSSGDRVLTDLKGTADP
ncbi:MAG: hypothetical protein JW785_08555, partial [Acidimicrobiia bacterium]|nr:hypothetical protein [Acidimicrobiia bacterium]